MSLFPRSEHFYFLKQRSGSSSLLNLIELVFWPEAFFLALWEKQSSLAVFDSLCALIRAFLLMLSFIQTWKLGQFLLQITCRQDRINGISWYASALFYSNLTNFLLGKERW